MLTTDKVERAAAALYANQIPHPDDLAAMMAAWRRMQSGLKFTDATGRTGPIMLKERNRCLLAYAETLNPVGNLGPWAMAGRLDKALHLHNTPHALADAVRLGASILSRQQLYRILDANTDAGPMLQTLSDTCAIVESQRPTPDAKPRCNSNPHET